MQFSVKKPSHNKKLTFLKSQNLWAEKTKLPVMFLILKTTLNAIPHNYKPLEYKKM